MQDKITVVEIIENYLKDNGFDGLYNEIGECACKINDLAPCGQIDHTCKAGYLIKCENEDYDFCIGERKQ